MEWIKRAEITKSSPKPEVIARCISKASSDMVECRWPLPHFMANSDACISNIENLVRDIDPDATFHQVNNGNK